MNETSLQNAIRLALSEYGVVIRQNTGNFELKDGRWVKCGVKGLSDLLFVGRGRVAFIEVKTPTGRASAEQLAFLEKMRELGHSAGIAHSVDEALKIAGV
ncbi:MAG: VRR-NUC domain-containing protein [Bacteroides sp.]|nr:VRR-NUC domain-containing protein [Eubacterium sp.]MCM1419676.1 VRR-NUC domain-containing protein [Roseburia sp.]MCM1463665.1 VRR-NUC domain-containing protein [Bacteroides sp.]